MDSLPEKFIFVNQKSECRPMLKKNYRVLKAPRGDFLTVLKKTPHLSMGRFNTNQLMKKLIYLVRLHLYRLF